MYRLVVCFEDLLCCTKILRHPFLSWELPQHRGWSSLRPRLRFRHPAVSSEISEILGSILVWVCGALRRACVFDDF